MADSTEFVSRTEYDTLHKQFKKIQKQMRKVLKHFKELDVNEDKPKKLSGFAKPTKVSLELSTFLGIPEDELIARTEVTKRINKYVKENGLQNPENKRVIVLDDTLKKLIAIPDDVQLTFFNLQKYIKHHYTDFQNTSEEIKVDISEKKTVEETPKKVVKKKVKK